MEVTATVATGAEAAASGSGGHGVVEEGVAVPEDMNLGDAVSAAAGPIPGAYVPPVAASVKRLQTPNTVNPVYENTNR